MVGSSGTGRSWGLAVKMFYEGPMRILKYSGNIFRLCRSTLSSVCVPQGALNCVVSSRDEGLLSIHHTIIVYVQML